MRQIVVTRVAVRRIEDDELYGPDVGVCGSAVLLSIHPASVIQGPIVPTPARKAETVPRLR